MFRIVKTIPKRTMLEIFLYLKTYYNKIVNRTKYS